MNFKNVYFLLLVLVSLFAFSFYTNKSMQDVVSTQIASIAGIQITAVYEYQKLGGLKRTLQIGDEGKDVRMIQNALHKIAPNFPIENVTGYFGQKTSAAVSEFQKQNNLPVTGTVDHVTLSSFNEIYVEELCPDGTDNNNFNNEILIRVGKDNPLPSGYIPENLINISKKVNTQGVICLKKEVVDDLILMFKNASRDGHTLQVTSGFRRPEIQGLIYKVWNAVLGDKAKKEVALPYHSEHQLGTTVDITGASNNFVSADDDFDNSKEGIWLKDNAYKFGFVMSYPPEKTKKTGYIHEPWHYRYVGKTIAKEIYKKGLSTEEYFKLNK